MKTMSILPGPVWLPHIVAAVLAIRDKIRQSREDSDLNIIVLYKIQGHPVSDAAKGTVGVNKAKPRW